MQHCVGQIPQYHNPMTNYYPTPVPYQYQLTTPAAQKVRTYELKDSFLKFYLLLQCFVRNYLKKCSNTNSNALSFYRSKTILDMSESVIFDTSKLFWTGTNVLDMAQNVKYSSEKLLLDRSKTFWAGPKQFGRIQNCFGVIEGQGIVLPRLPIVLKV